MNVCIVGGGGGASNAANVIRRLDREARIDIFTDRAEIGNQPCEIPFVLKGDLPSWDDTVVFKKKFYSERDINVHFNTDVTELIRPEKRITAGGESYGYDKLILALGATPTVPYFSGLDGKNDYSLGTDMADGVALGGAVARSTEAAVVVEDLSAWRYLRPSKQGVMIKSTCW